MRLRDITLLDRQALITGMDASTAPARERAPCILSEILPALILGELGIDVDLRLRHRHEKAWHAVHRRLTRVESSYLRRFRAHGGVEYTPTREIEPAAALEDEFASTLETHRITEGRL